MPKIPTPEDLNQRWTAGDSVYAIAQHYGVARPTVMRWLEENGHKPRDRSEAALVRSSRMTPEERLAQVAHAHEAVRGRLHSMDERQKFAATRAAKASAGTWRRSPLEVQLGHWLNGLGVNYIPEQVVAGYNVDFGIEPVAVELLGGAWHAQAKRQEYHARRTAEILSTGWGMIFIWSLYQVPVGKDSAVALSKAIKAVRPGEYRILRADGVTVETGDRVGADFQLRVPSIKNLRLR